MTLSVVLISAMFQLVLKTCAIALSFDFISLCFCSSPFSSQLVVAHCVRSSEQPSPTSPLGKLAFLSPTAPKRSNTSNVVVIYEAIKQRRLRSLSQISHLTFARAFCQDVCRVLKEFRECCLKPVVASIRSNVFVVSFL